MTHACTAGRVSRRSLLGGSLAATAATALPGGAFAAGNERLRIGLVGCGGRGVGAAIQAVTSAAGVELTAIGDLFDDQVSAAAAAVAMFGRQRDPLLRFVGPRAAEQVIAADVDFVILATPPHLRPRHAALAIRSNRHVFCETPLAIDAAGASSLLTVAAEARARGLSAVCGFHARRHAPTASLIGRIHAGHIGRVTQAVALSELGLPWRRPRQPLWTDDDHEVRNWIESSRLSGGPLVEHQIHAIDRALWALGDEAPDVAEPAPRGASPLPEARAQAGAVTVVYRFRDGRTLEAGIARREGIETRVEERVVGTSGAADLRAALVAGPTASGRSPHASFMDEVIRGIREGRRLDDLEAGCRSTMVAILGRDAARAGVAIRWDDFWRAGIGEQPPQTLQSSGV